MSKPKKDIIQVLHDELNEDGLVIHVQTIMDDMDKIVVDSGGFIAQDLAKTVIKLKIITMLIKLLDENKHPALTDTRGMMIKLIKEST